MKGDYRFVDHTADVEFVARGSSIEETFRNAFLALFDTALYVNKVARDRSKAKRFEIKEEAADLEQLLWYVLQDTVSVMDSRSLFPYRIASLKIEERKDIYRFRAEIWAKGQKAENAKLDIKGISRYGLKVSRKGKGFEASVVMDV
jgi:SHS2 domain-containing protein